MEDRPMLTLNRLEALLETPMFRCPSECGDNRWHMIFPASLVEKYREAGGDVARLGRFCEFPPRVVGG